MACAAGCSATRVGGEGPVSQRGPQFLSLCQEPTALHSVEGDVAPQEEPWDTGGFGKRTLLSPSPSLPLTLKVLLLRHCGASVCLLQEQFVLGMSGHPDTFPEAPQRIWRIGEM